MAFKEPPAVSDPGSNGIITRTAASTYTSRTITGTSNQITVTNGDGVSGNPTLSFPTTFLTSSTWTPVVEGTTVAGTGTYSIQVGYYQRIGGIVFVFGRVYWTAHTGTGNMRINNLPVNTSATTNYTQRLAFRTAVSANTVFTNPFVWYVLFGNSPNAQPVSFNNGAGSVTGQAIPGAGELIIEGCYII